MPEGLGCLEVSRRRGRGGISMRGKCAPGRRKGVGVPGCEATQGRKGDIQAGQRHLGDGVQGGVGVPGCEQVQGERSISRRGKGTWATVSMEGLGCLDVSRYRGRGAFPGGAKAPGRRRGGTAPGGRNLPCRSRRRVARRWRGYRPPPGGVAGAARSPPSSHAPGPPRRGWTGGVGKR